jgi:anti-sigma B factor antagonist
MPPTDPPSTPLPGWSGARSRREGHSVVLSLEGDIDTESAPLVARAVSDALARGDRHVCVDLRAVRFVDSSGLAMLLGLRRTVARAHRDLALVYEGGTVCRLLALTDTARLFAHHRDVDAALRAFAEDDAGRTPGGRPPAPNALGARGRGDTPTGEG